MAGPFEFTVQVKYVRREIRSLTDMDREMFFNAVSVMQRVPSGVGQLVYGTQYYSKDYLTRLHLYYGQCDGASLLLLLLLCVRAPRPPAV